MAGLGEICSRICARLSALTGVFAGGVVCSRRCPTGSSGSPLPCPVPTAAPVPTVMVVLERESMLRHPLMVALAGVSTLSLTTAATADLTNGTIEFELTGYEFATFVWECDLEYDDITGVFSDVTITNVDADIDFEPEFNITDHGLPTFTFRNYQGLSCTILLDAEGYGPMQIYMDLQFNYSQTEGWQGSLTGTYGPPMPFGAGESFTGDWNARVVPAPGALALLGVAGLAGRRRRD